RLRGVVFSRNVARGSGDVRGGGRGLRCGRCCVTGLRLPFPAQIPERWLSMKRFTAIAFTFAAGILPAHAHACATCFGAAGDPQTEGRNAAILPLLTTTYTLLTGMAAAVFVLWRRARNIAAAESLEQDRG